MTNRAPLRILAVTAVLYPLVAVLAPKAMVVLLSASALLVAVAPVNRRAPVFQVPGVMAAILGGLALWALATTLWTLAPGNSLGLLLRVAALAAAGLYLMSCAARLDETDRHAFATVLAVSGVLFVTFFLFELATGGALTSVAIAVWNWLTPWDSPPRYQGSFLASASAALVVVIWPCALGLARRTSIGWALALLVGASVAIFGQNMSSAKIALVFAVIAGVTMWRWPRFSGVAVFSGLTVANIALFIVVYSRGAPGLVGWLADALSVDVLPLPWQERIYIIDFALEKVAEQPLFGWGLDASRTISAGIVGPFHGNPAIPLHPHSLWLQIWLELGLVGVALALALVGLAITKISLSRADPMVAATAIAMVVSYLVVGNISFGAWQSWWLAIAWLGVGFVSALVPRQTVEGA